MGEQPRSCSGGQRNGSPRLVSPRLPGTRHPVFVSNPEGKLRVLMTNKAVIHGSPRSPCVSALDAEWVRTEVAPEGDNEHAILPLEDLERSWLFRSRGSGRFRKVEYRTMSCRFEPRLRIPLELYKVDGTLVRRR